jgi:PhnB protein
MLDFNPYLHFNGKAGEAMHFYKSIFGGEFIIYSRYAEMAGAEKLSPEEQERFIHISLAIGDVQTIMASDNLDAMHDRVTPGSNFHICIQTESEKEADKLFKELSKNGEVEMPMNRTFWGAYFGMCRDQFEVKWMINYTPNQK